MQVKLCGFRNKESILAAIESGADFIGFVFCENSARYISPKESCEVAKIIPKNVAKVAVIADANLDLIEEIYQNLKPDYFQFHGSESADFSEEIKAKYPEVKIIKAFRISDENDLKQVKDFEKSADLFLFDSKHNGALGGTGKSFNWKILSNLQTDKNWFLSGGLNRENISKAIKETGANMIDISSGIERIKGEKSIDLIKQFMSEVK